MHTIERQHFQKSRSLEYLELKELQSMTGQPSYRFAEVVLKELIDNAIDAAELNPNPKVDVDIRKQSNFVDSSGNELLRISVTDNGPGMSGELIRKITNFSTRTSDKEVYVAATRGAQGNALKCILGIPVALRGSDDNTSRPIIFESRGKKYLITIEPDFVLEEPNVKIEESESEVTNGTRVSVYIDACKDDEYDDEYDYDWKSRFVGIINGYVFFNPHVEIIYRTDIFDGNFPPRGTLNKRTIKDPTNVHHYTNSDFIGLTNAEIKRSIKNDSKCKTIREFIKDFEGLKSSRKQKAVTSQFSNINRLSQIANDDKMKIKIKNAIEREVKNIKPRSLGIIGRDCFREAYECYYKLEQDIKYKSVEGYFNREGARIPFLIEMSVVETPGNPFYLYTGINFAPTYDNPFEKGQGDAYFKYSSGNNEIGGWGLNALLGNLKIEPEDEITIVVHLTCPNLEFKDKGKTTINLPKAIVDAIAEASWLTCKDHYKHKKKLERDYAKQRREEELLRKSTCLERPNKTRATFNCLPEAIEKASSGGKYRFSARSLWYKLRPIIAREYDERWIPDYDYFTPSRLTKYQEEYGDIEGIYYESRGKIILPHREPMDVDTISVETFEIEKYKFNKVLYCEKKGKLPVLEDAQIAERYSMPILAEAGFSTRAGRALLKKFAEEGIKVFCVHDADINGYEIARTLQQSTRTLKDYSLEVIDLGLTVEDAKDMGLQVEQYALKKEPSEKLWNYLDEDTLNWLLGERRGYGKTKYIANRIELDAMGSKEFIKWLEQKLRENNATEKTIPPKKYLNRKARVQIQSNIESSISIAVKNRVKIYKICKAIEKKVLQLKKAEINKVDLFKVIKNKLKNNPPRDWDTFLSQETLVSANRIVADREVDKIIENVIVSHITKLSEKICKK